MSAFLDAIINSDRAEQDIPSDGTVRPARRARSASGPRGPPSVSTSGMHSDMPGFEDDELVGARGLPRPTAGRNIIPVVDATAESLALNFQDFLDRYV